VVLDRDREAVRGANNGSTACLVPARRGALGWTRGSLRSGLCHSENMYVVIAALPSGRPDAALPASNSAGDHYPYNTADRAR
jgi:hypothetical protein